ncbi:anti-sigma factor [Streptomyces sp. N35]|uniref:anti-sigma factor family protein n=1 Tax=Streptomyces sp. N35 TaxID=2795730 RepID=UPI001F44E0A0|nr:hypothetical protein [Streptomyces sp. N35]
MSAQHQDVAAYALGVLEPADSLHVEEHLGDCLHCALELVEFSRVVALLEPLASRESVALSQAPPAQLLDRLLVQVRVRRPAGRLRWVAAAAAVLVALPTGAALVREDSPRVFDSRAGTLTASVALDEQPWGTQVALRMDRLDGPRRCELVAVGPGGTEQTVLSWSVPRGGYGFPGRDGHEGPLLTEGGTGLRADQIRRFEVRTLEGDRLLSIPAG